MSPLTAKKNPNLAGLFAHWTFCDVYYGQTAGWIKIPLDTEVCLGLGDIVLAGDPAIPYGKRHSSPPLFGPCLL